MKNSIARVTHTLAATGLVAAMFAVAGAQQPPAAGTPAPQGAPQPRPGTFPAQQRPPGDPAVIARGKTLYDATCAFCHGKDLRGGENGGPNLLRSEVTL